MTSEEPGALPDQLIYGLAVGIPQLCQDMIDGKYGWLYNLIKGIEIDIGLGTMTGEALVDFLTTAFGKQFLQTILKGAIPGLMKTVIGED